MQQTIPLEQPSAKGPPSATFHEPGAYLVAGLVNVGEYHQTDFDTGAKLYWDDQRTEPRMGKVVTALVKSAAGHVTLRQGDDVVPVQPGDLVTFWCEGGKFYTWRDAVQEAGGSNVGDVFKWERMADRAPKRAGMNPQKVYEARLRRPKAEEASLVERCITEHLATKQRPALEERPGPFDEPTPQYTEPEPEPEPEF